MKEFTPEQFITEEHRRAVALSYEAGEPFPRVSAKGFGQVAEKIIEEARRNGIFVHDSPELVGLLMRLDLDDAIPESLYLVIAELLVWIADLETKAAG